MKKLYSIIICMIAIMVMSSCSFFDDDKSSKETTEVRNIVELPDSIKQKIVEQDALMIELLNKVDTLTAELNATKTANAELKEKVAELKSPKSTWAYVSMGAFVLGLIALLFALFRPKGIKEEKVYEIVKECLDNSQRIKELQVHVNNLLSAPRSSRNSQTGSSYAPKTDSRLCQLENQMSQVIAVVNKMTAFAQSTTQTHADTPKPRKDAEYQKVGYAKNDTGTYFTTIYESNQEGCVFKISFMSPTKGRFNIISLDKIQSRNDWQQKIVCSGISIKEASGFRIEEEGLCEKIEENTWQVTKPLKIRLLN